MNKLSALLLTGLMVTSFAVFTLGASEADARGRGAGSGSGARSHSHSGAHSGGYRGYGGYSGYGGYGGYSGHGGGARVGVYVAAPSLYYANPYYGYAPYYAPPYYPPVVITPPPVYVEQAVSVAPAQPQAAQFWYFCQNSQTYYPHVQTCASPWQRVLPHAPR